MDTPGGLGALRSLDYTMLLCDDVAMMRAFYADVLGLDVQREVPGRYVELRVGSATLALRRRGRPYDGPAPLAASASVQLAFRVPPNDVDIAAAQLVAGGAELLEPVRSFPEFGHRAVFFADPEQNVIEIYAEV
ncbi:Glyoxalase/bleomycin resistance protein/dioxygenase [Beutenbergia cavernae DSM 12333]|uniref:Glyoxalase/bleomycin resistance protein/dioxygenase n=1 Tax=Beutenbergia cavernae (strain ATCC BAA-8 / DSM 12333 / CCUG 43141 / JCM 11478 / NBRC 16432 / NCIMB 13614 / HKI 0122) TaxID=471853 RepID=C5BUQ3_BEUC1|nr:VOC family protein [Beutenbergia cavernae]ACQ78277.1 Glyoxalase/bleomycin resistance protein/dioxygenase [Beutenbergia cavernae DSM 12333]